MQLIRDWEELSKLPPSETHFLKVDVDGGFGEVYVKDGNSDSLQCYLSTHTFYKPSHGGTPNILQQFGWDIILDNWDKVE